MTRPAPHARLTGTEMFYGDTFFASLEGYFPSIRRMSAVVTPSGGLGRAVKTIEVVPKPTVLDTANPHE